MVTRMPAKLKKNNQNLMNMAFVLDSYGIADMFQYLLGKNADFVNALFQNGYINQDVAGAAVYCSENLTGTSVLSLATQPTDGDTITIGGVTFTFKTAVGSTEGNVLIGASADAARANLALAINKGTGAGTNYIELTTADRRTITKSLRLTATNDNTADTLTVVGTGSGRLTVSETLTDATDTWTKNYISAYFGKKGGIDVVIQKESKMDAVPEPKQPGSRNISSTIIYGIKTFADGAQRFLNVKIAA
jgi:hypothetical protein